MIQFWRPSEVDWGNRWPAQDALNERLNAGWTLVTILPPDEWSHRVPTFVLRNRQRWRRPGDSTRWQYWRFLVKFWWCKVLGAQAKGPR